MLVCVLPSLPVCVSFQLLHVELQYLIFLRTPQALAHTYLQDELVLLSV